MGKPGAFLDIDRVTHELRPVEERSHDFDPLYVELDDDARRAQASRCMMCGVLPDGRELWQGTPERLPAAQPDSRVE